DDADAGHGKAPVEGFTCCVKQIYSVVLDVTSTLADVNKATRDGVAPLDAREEAFFRALARAVVTGPRAFDADLIREQGMSRSEYTTLMHLSEAPGCWMRMSDIAAAADLSLSGITRI